MGSSNGRTAGGVYPAEVRLIGIRIPVPRNEYESKKSQAWFFLIVFLNKTKKESLVLL